MTDGIIALIVVGTVFLIFGLFSALVCWSIAVIHVPYPLKRRKENKKPRRDCGNCGFGAITHREYPGTCPQYRAGEDEHCVNWTQLQKGQDNGKRES